MGGRGFLWRVGGEPVLDGGGVGGEEEQAVECLQLFFGIVCESHDVVLAFVVQSHFEGLGHHFGFTFRKLASGSSKNIRFSHFFLQLFLELVAFQFIITCEKQNPI